MSAKSVPIPFPVFNDLEGNPLENGFVYVGKVNLNPIIEDDRVTVYWDKSLTIPAEQPLRTIGGYLSQNGTPGVLYTNEDDVSITVQDSNNVFLYNSPTTTQLFSEEQFSGDFPSSRVSFTQNGVGAVERTVEDKFKDSINVKDFGAIGDGVVDDYNAILACWEYCLANARDMYFPDGTYQVENNNMPMGRVGSSPPVSLLDCKNITVFGNGKSTILKTKSLNGADVLQLNGSKNFHVKNLTVTAELTGFSGSGSNGVSITGGGENISLENIQAIDLPYIDKTTFLDGGKGFTLQMSNFSTSLGSIVITNCYAKGCVFGFNSTTVLDDTLTEKMSLNVNGVAEDCWFGFTVDSPASGVPVPAGFSSGVNITGTAINCQHSLNLDRVHGGEFDINVINNKTKADLKLDPSGSDWSTSLDLNVGVLCCTYAHNSKISVFGWANTVDHKAQIGGSAPGGSGLTGATNNSQFYLDIGGTSDVADIEAVNSGGNTMSESVLYVSTTTSASDIPLIFYSTANNNTLVKGPARKLVKMLIDGPLEFSYTDGFNSFTKLERDTFAVYASQSGGSSPNIEGFGVKNHNGDKVFTIHNNGGIFSKGLNTAVSVNSIIKVLQVYDTPGGSILGYIPVYSGFS